MDLNASQHNSLFQQTLAPNSHQGLSYPGLSLCREGERAKSFFPKVWKHYIDLARLHNQLAFYIWLGENIIKNVWGILSQIIFNIIQHGLLIELVWTTASSISGPTASCLFKKLLTLTAGHIVSAPHSRGEPHSCFLQIISQHLIAVLLCH